MTLRDRLSIIVENALKHSDVLDDEILDANNNLVFIADELSSKVDTLFAETGQMFIKRVRELIDQSAVGLPLDELFPNIKNIMVFLELVDLIRVEALDINVPHDLDEFNLTTIDLSAYDYQGEDIDLFVYQSTGNLDHSVAFIDCTSSNRFFKHQEPFPAEMLACLAIKVGEAQDHLQGRKWIISKIENDEDRLFYCKYHFLLCGHMLTKPVAISQNRALEGITNSLTSVDKYQQFREPFEILSEANSRKTLLDLFLSCYHAVENYMIRYRIAEVVNNGDNNRLFGIRHFKNLEISVSENEMAHFRLLFVTMLPLEIGAQTFKDFVINQFDEFITANPNLLNEFQKLLVDLTVKKSGKTLDITKEADVLSLIPNMLYQVRCSIVHNKATEYHLSNRELSQPIIKSFLGDFCIPVLQRLAFGIPSIKHIENPLVYREKYLELY